MSAQPVRENPLRPLWIGAASRLQEQPARRSRILFGELLGQLPNEQQLTLVIRIKGFAHASLW